jgi:two-component sensor histidine kinase/PAS domain-containing protein
VTLFAGQVGYLNRQRASQIAGCAAVALAAAGFISWWVPLPLPSGWSPGFATVKPMTALCFIALGMGLAAPGRTSLLAAAVGIAVAAVAVLDLLERFGIDSGVSDLNRYLVPQAAVLGPEASFRTINGLPLTLAFAGVSLALSRFERGRFVATALSGLACLMQAYDLLAYISGVHRFYGVIGTPTPLAALGLLLVNVAIVLRVGAVLEVRKPRPLWRLLIMLGCAIVTPLLLFGVYTGLRITDAQLRATRYELMSAARSLSANVDREITGEIKRLRALAASRSLRLGDFAEFQRQAEASLPSGQGGNIMLIDRSLRPLVNTSAPFGTVLGNAAVPQSVEKALATGNTLITGLFRGPASSKPAVAVIVPVQIDGEDRYALVGSSDVDLFARLVAFNELPVGWQAAVFDGEHRVIVGSGGQDALTGTEPPQTSRHREGSGGIAEFVDLEGRPSLEGYAWSEVTGWETAVWASMALLEEPGRMLWWTIGLTALAAFALVGALASWLGRLIARSVGQATRAATTLGKSAPLSWNETPVAEINTLMVRLRETGMELREAAARRQAAERDLQTSKDRLQLAFDATQLGWWQYDLFRKVYSGDARFKEIFDVTGDEISIDVIMQRVHPDDAERFWANREAALDPANPEPYVHHEYRVRWRNGAIRWVAGNGLAYFEGAGPGRRAVSFGGTVQDISERREREEKEHLLMREINHRAKNMLSVIASIAHQTATRNPEDFVERFAERIQALSANQDLLVRNEWSGVAVADLVRAQLAHFADLIGPRIALRGPRLRLNPAAAQGIGLALHELATNAGKYGALSTGAGRVDIRWGTADGGLTMSWTERGGPPVSRPQRRGFGSIVMEAMAEHSVGGKVDIDYAPSGFTWRLTCPAANALESEWRTGRSR